MQRIILTVPSFFKETHNDEYKQCFSIITALVDMYPKSLSVKTNVSTEEIDDISISINQTRIGNLSEFKNLIYSSFSNGVFTSIPSDSLLSSSVSSSCRRLFISGDRSQVGKSTTCLGLIASLINSKRFQPEELAYIKPATQCEAPTLVTRYCSSVGIDTVPTSPIVFYAGFTREYLAGNTLSSATYLSTVQEVVNSLSVGKRLVIIDGVGYPAVGSICHLSNADVAKAARADGVLLVGKSGVGDAVDSYNLNAAFFHQYGVKVLGGIFNKISRSGYYSIDKVRPSVTEYFRQSRMTLPYGFIPEFTKSCEANEASDLSAEEEEFIKFLVEHMQLHVDINRLLADLQNERDRGDVETVIVAEEKRPEKRVKTREEINRQVALENPDTSTKA